MTGHALARAVEAALTPVVHLWARKGVHRLSCDVLYTQEIRATFARRVTTCRLCLDADTFNFPTSAAWEDANL